ncbi:MAG TPA: hypothetical protein VF755_21995 [Catenuloplanes sp.]
MHCDMALRALYLPANTTIDLTAAKATATRLCGQATTDDLARMLDNDTFADIPITDINPPVCAWSDELVSRHTAPLRRWAEQCLHWLLDEFTASLHHREVLCFHFGVSPSAGDEGVDAYVTGGLNFGAAPTEPYDSWAIFYDSDRYPTGWSDAIGAAAGLLHPHGRGVATRAVTFYAWG